VALITTAQVQRASRRGERHHRQELSRGPSSGD
jgi:hypothetical protein